jgi:hypothetical protein
MLVAALLRKHAGEVTDAADAFGVIDGEPIQARGRSMSTGSHYHESNPAGQVRDKMEGREQMTSPLFKRLMGCGGSSAVAPRRILVGGVEHGEAPSGLLQLPCRELL